MSLAIFVSNYPGTVDDATRALLLDNGGTGGAIPDLWLQFFNAQGITEGTIDDRTRAFLLTYLSETDVGQTVDDLWGAVDAPYTP